MVISIAILFCFSLKLILAKKQNEIIFSFQLKDSNDEERLKQCIANLTKNDITKEEKTKSIVCILEEIRDNPKMGSSIIKFFLAFKDLYLKKILENFGVEFLYDLLDEILHPNHPFIDDLFYVIGNHTELIDYILIFVKKDEEGKNITTYESLEIIKNITNIDGMDKVFGHIINSPHNIALIKLVEIKFINGTEYAELYDYLKNDTIYPYKNQLIKLAYKILKSGLLIPRYKSEDETIILDIINLLQNVTNSIKPKIIKDLESILRLNNMTFLYNLTMEILNSTFFDDLFNALKNNTDLLRATSTFIIDSINRNITEEKFFKFTSKLLNDTRIEEIIGRVVNSTHNIALLKFAERLMEGQNYFDLYNYLKKDLIYPFKDQIIPLIYKILKNGENKTKIIEVVKNFFQANINSNLTQTLRNKLKEKGAKEAFGKIVFKSEVGEIIKQEILARDEIIDGFFNFLNDNTITEIIASIIVHRNDPVFILKNVPPMIAKIHEIDKGYIKLILEVTVKVLKRIVTEKSVTRVLTQSLTKHLFLLYFQNETEKYNINEECTSSMKKIYFDTNEELNISNDEEAKASLAKLRYFFMKKTMIDSTKNKNDFLTYENCLEKNFDNKIIENLNFSFTLNPIYVLAMFDDKEAKKNLSDLILLEQYNYWLGYCLPRVTKKNGTDDIEICNQTDYGNLLRIFLEFSFNMTNAEVRSFNISKKEFELKDKLFCALNLFIILIPILIQIILYLYYSISYYKYKKRKIFNQLTINQEEEMEMNKHLSVQHKRSINIQNFKIITPKWYKYLNEYFNLIKNGAELFNNNLKESNINNINGITYIKGLLGLSLLLYIFGHVFFMLFNLPFKNFTLTTFNSSVKNPFFFIPLIGLRYSSRIILSCSGYTLIYKYLNYIYQQPKLYMLKFIFRQSYKYLLLLFVVLYMRYSIYYLTLILNDLRRPMTEILKYNLELNNKDYFVNFFDFLLAYIGDFAFNNKQNIIQYFYVPLNEIFLFLFGVILISLGYRYKFRNDIIIIIIISLIFVVKILIYFLYVKEYGKYSTLYYYLYDYGAIMLNPIFNLPSFLIGMFFGLVNYSIQKGITIFRSDSYQRITNLDNRVSSINPKESVSIDRQTFLEKQTTLINSKKPISMELDNYNESTFKNEKKDYAERMFSVNIPKDKNSKKQIQLYNKNVEKNFTINLDIGENGRRNSKNEDYNEKIKEMPFLILPTKFLNFHRNNEGKFFFKVIIILFILVTALVSCVHFVIVGRKVIVDKKKDDKIKTLEKLSFREVITNTVLNVIYSIDIDLVVFMINWVFFIIYSKGKSADIYDFFNNNFWSFFLKCYYSFIIISTPVILCIIYQNEIVINFSFSNLILFSFISLFIIIITVIFCYSMYEMPLKKIFKSILVKEEIFSDNANDDIDTDFDSSIQ